MVVRVRFHKDVILSEILLSRVEGKLALGGKVILPAQASCSSVPTDCEAQLSPGG